eukprot:gb/GECG01003608.1/.p1 GENE.gb/GECG01003608.1/~~gb/GECG01003608.1/.p1  ORF type:complete len:225 (+),score=39.34 gb/GECG01003608.1/:1-675(+)
MANKASETGSGASATSAGGKRSFDKQFKVLLLGDSGVGKTNLLTRYIDDSFCKTFVTTIGIDYKVKTLNVDGYKVKLHLWDTAGQERFRTITSSYYRGANAVLLVFDMTKRDTFEKVETWAQQIREHNAHEITMLVVGNKCDADSTTREVSDADGERLAKYLGADYVSTSAKDNINVDEAFRTLATHTLRAALAASGEGQSGKAGSGFKVGEAEKEEKGKSKCC